MCNSIKLLLNERSTIIDKSIMNQSIFVILSFASLLLATPAPNGDHKKPPKHKDHGHHRWDHYGWFFQGHGRHHNHSMSSQVYTTSSTYDTAGPSVLCTESTSIETTMIVAVSSFAVTSNQESIQTTSTISVPLSLPPAAATTLSEQSVGTLQVFTTPAPEFSVASIVDNTVTAAEPPLTLSEAPGISIQ